MSKTLTTRVNELWRQVTFDNCAKLPIAQQCLLSQQTLRIRQYLETTAIVNAGFSVYCVTQVFTVNKQYKAFPLIMGYLTRWFIKLRRDTNIPEVYSTTVVFGHSNFRQFFKNGFELEFKNLLILEYIENWNHWIRDILKFFINFLNHKFKMKVFIREFFSDSTSSF